MNDESSSEFSRIGLIKDIIEDTGSTNALSSAASLKRAGIDVGIGDDTAVLDISSMRGKMLFCSDMMVERVDFDLSYCSASDIGHKAVAACASDIAAMNGHTQFVLISLALPASVSDRFVAQFFEAAKSVAQSVGATIVGGDLSSIDGPITIDVSCIGFAENPVLRSTAKPGDVIVVSGPLGGSAAGLALLQGPSALFGQEFEELEKLHLRPMPRFDALAELNFDQRFLHAMLDLSDGLSSDLNHLANASKVGFIINESSLPTHPLAKQLAQRLQFDAHNWALNGGEDYQLLATVDSDLWQQHQHASTLTAIGSITHESNGRWLERLDGSRQPLVARGFTHFRPD